MTNHKTVIARNRDYIPDLMRKLKEAVSPLCNGVNNYALVDFPDHSNVGDSAIYLGEVKLLREILQRDPRFVSKARNHIDDIEKFDTVDAIFLHGGGNFGDLWPAHQRFRERLISRYPDRKIVQLPQTLFFKDSEALDRCSKVISQHPDFTLLVRDKRSYRIARESFDCAVVLSPDCAMALGPLPGTGSVTRPKLAMLRQDQETQLAREEIVGLTGSTPVEDWIEEPKFKPPQGAILDKLMPLLGPLRVTCMPALATNYESWATIRVNRGLAQLSSADFILTDRLHVHILATLLGLDHIVLDNSYGKISTYAECWGLPSNAKFTRELTAVET